MRDGRNTLAHTKPAGTWSYTDLATLPDDGTLYEILNAEFYEMPSPTRTHAIGIVDLIRLLLPVLD